VESLASLTSVQSEPGGNLCEKGFVPDCRTFRKELENGHRGWRWRDLELKSVCSAEAGASDMVLVCIFAVGK